MILINNRQRRIPVNSGLLEEILQAMLTASGYPDFALGLLITTNESIRVYNKNYRNKDKATDILSFPYHTDHQAGKKIKVTCEEDKNLGDIIISLAYVIKKAPEFDRSFEEHFRALLAHGITHLLNYDHDTDADYKKMQKVEQKLIAAISSYNNEKIFFTKSPH